MNRIEMFCKKFLQFISALTINQIIFFFLHELNKRNITTVL